MAVPPFPRRRQLKKIRLEANIVHFLMKDLQSRSGDRRHDSTPIRRHDLFSLGFSLPVPHELCRRSMMINNRHPADCKRMQNGAIQFN